MPDTLASPPVELQSTGITGLDHILGGGLTPGGLYLIEGESGCGKTTLGLQFLAEGARLGEPVLYITLAESEAELRAVAISHGWTLHGIHIHEVIGTDALLDADHQYTMFHPAEIELGATLQTILRAVEQRSPCRVVLDSLSELQLLSEHPLRYRRQVLALKQFFAARKCTSLFLDDRTVDNGDMQVRSIAHGVIRLQREMKDYGTERRRLHVVKYRGMAFRGGYHDYTIVRGGLVAYPRLVASETREIGERRQITTGLPKLDTMLGGGIEQGSSTLVSGPTGTGKSTLAAQVVFAALERGERAAMFLFEESAGTLLYRAAAMHMDLRPALETGALQILQIDPAEMWPGQFADVVCDAARKGASVIVIDSLNGYLNAMPDEPFLTIHLHELLSFLGQRGVATFLVGVHREPLGALSTSLEASYIADNIVLLNHFENGGELCQAISILKKRGSAHERTLRRFTLSSAGVAIGDVLQGLQGIFTGVPRKEGPGDSRA